METLIKIFGEGKDLDTLQMCSRATVIFFITLALIRISGRRSFGLKNAFDNIIGILLGAILSRTIIGASPFLPTVAAALVICLIHRLCGWACLRSPAIDKLMNGEKIPVYKDGAYLKDKMDKAMVNERDVTEELRLKALTEDLQKIQSIYMERNGEISAIRKE